MATHYQTRQFTTDDFLKMGEAGIIGREERVELIEGELLAMSPIGAKHNWCVSYLTKQLVQQLGNHAEIYTQGSLLLSNQNQPQPDIAVLKMQGREYESRLPNQNDVLVLIEVADSSLSFDLDHKMPLYAKSGIPEFWLVDLTRAKLICHSNPRDSQYLNRREFAVGDKFQTTIASILIELDLSRLL